MCFPCSTSSNFLRQNKDCYTLLYSPVGIPIVERVVAAIIANNSPAIPREHVWVSKYVYPLCNPSECEC